MISIPEVAGEIIRLTRVEAERIGVTQTPVFLGSLQGGLVFPVLKRGDARCRPMHEGRKSTSAQVASRKRKV